MSRSSQTPPFITSAAPTIKSKVQGGRRFHRSKGDGPCCTLAGAIGADGENTKGQESWPGGSADARSQEKGASPRIAERRTDGL
jgi:hypothetical protein